MMLLQLFWGQLESATRLRQLLRVLALCTALCVSGAVYGLWYTQTGLATAQASVRSLQKQAAQLSQTLRAKRERMAQTQTLQTADPLGAGSMQFTDELSRLAHATGVQIGTCHITAGGSAPLPAAIPAGGANAPQAANAAKGAANATPPATPAPRSRWSQAIFDYEFTGSFHSLSMLIQELAAMPRIIEIDSFDLSRSQLSGPQANVIVHLRITGAVYGLPETDRSQ